MNNCLLVIVFSYNRAMQLDFTLRSMLQHFACSSYRVFVLYHCSSSHLVSYDILREQYKHEARVVFCNREQGKFVVDVLPYLFRPRNLYRYFKHSHLRKIGCEFKTMLENTMFNTQCEFIMFSTDDTVFYRRQCFAEDEMMILRANPAQRSLRFYVGSNLNDCPPGLETLGGFMTWDYYSRDTNGNWSYPFAVDATVYSVKHLLSVLKPVLYNSPSTLESFGCRQMALLKYFRNGFSPLISSVVGLPMNKVQNVVNNAHGNYDVLYLNEMFVKGFRLDIAIPDVVCSNAFIPPYIELYRGNERVQLYSDSQ